VTQTPRGLGLRRILVAGLLSTGPLVVTAYVLWIVFSYVDGILQPLFMRVLHFRVPGLGFLALLGLVLLTGLFASPLDSASCGDWRRGSNACRCGAVYRAVRGISEVLQASVLEAFARSPRSVPRLSIWALVFVGGKRFAMDGHPGPA
jgi:uncharacterized membrane protein